jgi:hypothetical protein
MASTYWPDANPIGRTFFFGGRDTIPVEVIGVVGDVRESGLENDPSPQMYFPAKSNLDINLALVVRGTGRTGALLNTITRAVRTVDPAQPVYNVRMMDDVIGASIAARRANTLLITLFGLLALLISALGVYAVTANAVSQRFREFGIRAALGATRASLLRLVGSELAEQSREVWLAADHSKFNRPAMVELARLDHLDRLFTDAAPPPPFPQLLAEAAVQCNVAA